MSASTQVLVNLLAQKYAKRWRDYMKYLPDEQQAIESIEPNPIFSSQQLLHDVTHMDPYWVVEAISNHPLKQCYASLFPVLKSYIQVSHTPKTIPSFVRNFLIAELVKSLDADQIPTIGLLPQEGVYKLVRLSVEQLHCLMELLAMNDLSILVKQVVDQKRLKHLDSALTTLQKKRLQLCLKLNCKPTVKALDPKILQLSVEDLRKKLMEIGLIRCAVALADHPHALVWHVVHKLSCDLAMILTQVYKKKHPVQNISSAKTELMFLMKGA